MSAPRRLELVVFILGCFAFAYVYSSCSKPVNNAEILQTERAPANSAEISAIPVIDPNADFSEFQHSNPAHARFPCALCHERKDNSAKPKLPGHMPCAGCHTVQFADNKSAICAICHTDAESGVVKAFPGLKSFNVIFKHAKHLNVANCADCHTPARNGVALSIPSGLNAHNACFECHSPGAQSGERSIDSCNVCHQPGKFGGNVSEWARAFEKTPFRHDDHRLECTVCHSIKAGVRGNQVSAPLAAMHLAPKNAQSCASCHNNKRAFGGDDFSDCRRCHRGSSYKFS